MKLFFNFFVIYFFLILINFSSLLANDFKETYIVEIGRLDIGKLTWSVKLSNDSYNIVINMKSIGFLSRLYKFEGNYETNGSVIGGSLAPLKYKQFWLTKKKKREVKITFNNGSLTELKILPNEEEHARIKYIGINNHFDPLSSFANILMGKMKSKTIDGRRIYSMAVEEQDNYEKLKIKKILIEDYINIWADHKKNDLEYIEITQSNGQEGFSMPEAMKIKFKGLLYKLRKI